METDSGFGLRVYTMHASFEESKQIIAGYYKSVVTMRELDLHEAQQFYSKLQKNM